MPNDSESAKIEAVKAYGAALHFCETDVQSIDNLIEKVQAEQKLFPIHPFNDYNVIAGQATVAYELIDEIEDLDYIVCSVWGGGLLAGSLLASHYFQKKGKIVKVCAAEADSVRNCFTSWKTRV
jgi:threonine dehydratase